MGETKTVAIIGAGPVGLAAAAHVLERGLTPIVLDAGADIGYAVRQWGHVQLFSPWEYNIDQAAARLLATTGWNSPEPDQYPTGAELLERYLEPLATKTVLKQHIRTSSRVTDISRVGFDKLKTQGREAAPFEIRYQNGQGPKTIQADAVLDISGTWFSPNPAGANGLNAIGELEASDKIAYAMPDVLGKHRTRYAGKTIAVLGAGHSAIGTLVDLVQLKAHAPTTEVIWLLRGNNPAKAFGGGANDKLAARGELGAKFAALVAAGKIKVEIDFRVTHVTREGDRLRIGSGSGCCGRNTVVDELVVATGFRSDLSFVRELRTQLDPAIECPVALAPLIDPNEHSCGTVRPHGARELAQPEPRFYFAGMKSYGRAPTFLMLTGYEQVRSIAAEIAGDHDAARRVQLMLPETGVCSRSSTPDTTEAGCCGGPAPIESGACCADDLNAKNAGRSGCGCSSTANVTVSKQENAMEKTGITEAVREKYAQAALHAGGSCCGGGAMANVSPITSNLYDQAQTDTLPEAALLASLGCGNPTALADLKPGETVLDLGSGGGIDVLLSARRVGPTGKAYGLDMTDEMLALARENQRKVDAHNVEFLKGQIEHIPLPDGSVDVIISNCVINLSADKDRVLQEAFRVLKPGGRFAVSDVVTRGQIPPDLRENALLWIGCIAGALDESDYRAKLTTAGFEQIGIEPTRVYKVEDAREFLTEKGIDVNVIAPQVDGKFMSAFVRAVKPNVPVKQ